MLHKRILAAATATFLALGMAVGGASPAMANGNPDNTCNGAGFEKPDELDNLDSNPTGSEDYEWGSISWDSPNVTITVDEGYTAELCIKGGNDGLVTSGLITGPDTWSTTHTSDLSHLGFTWDVVDVEPGLATASIDVTAPTCELGASLNEAGFVYQNATYEIFYDGPDYEVIFTANDDFEFEGGVTTQSFTGTLAGPDESLCEEPGLATASIDLTDPNCFDGEMLNEDGFDYENATYEIFYDGADFEVVFTADEGFEFENGMTTMTFTGTLAGPLEGDECILGLAQASLQFTAATCLDPETLEMPGEAQLENATVKSFSVNEETGEFEVVFELADGGDAFDTNQTDFVFGDYEKSVTATYNDDNTELTLSGMLDGPNEELCSEKSATAVAPTQVNTCEVQSYTLTAAEGVEYTVTVNDGDPTVVDFGDDTEATFMAETFDTVVINAYVLDGYAFLEGATTEWTFEFPLPEDCFPTAPVTTASVTWVQPDCLGNPGSYTLTNEPGVIWTVDGVVVQGNKTYTAAIGSTPSIEASLEPASEEFPTGFGWNDENQQTLWNLSFVAPTNCDLTTLALTGASNALGGLGMVAVLIMMAGTGLVVARRREAARIQG
jgi:hypothetical protein